MANFPTHVSTSIALGAAYGALGHVSYGMPLPSSALAAGLVAIGGILPDIDSDNAVVLRESLTLVAAVTPLLAMDRLQGMHWPQETIVLASVGMYLGIRFGIGSILKHFTVHRGMWHSLPAAAIAGIVVYFLAGSPNAPIRLFK
ncbi:MAG TPA: metal-dependent hydrolase, partial [Pirellulaceae bacterium]